jgi:adenylate cyclase
VIFAARKWGVGNNTVPSPVLRANEPGRRAVGTILLYGSAGLHFALAVRTLYGRRRWALSPAEWIRLWAGLSLPLLLIRHAVGTRVAGLFYGFEPNYERVVISDAWQHNLVALYLALIVGAVAAGQLHYWLERSGRPLAPRRTSPPER